MIEITRINHTAINTPSDVEAMRAFYCQHLGANTIERDIPPEYQALIPGFWMQFNNGQVHVIEHAQKDGPRDPMGPHIAFYVRSLGAAEQYLNDQSIDYDRVNNFIFIADPAGNLIELQQDPDPEL